MSEPVRPASELSSDIEDVAHTGTLDAYETWKDEEVIALIEADRKAVALAVLDELAPLLERSGRNQASLDLVRAKYTEKAT